MEPWVPIEMRMRRGSEELLIIEIDCQYDERDVKNKVSDKIA